MREPRTAVFVLLLMVAGAGRTQDDPQAKLAAFEGTWTVVGQEATYRETCSWFENRRFLVCKAEDKEGGNSSWTMSIMGWSAEKQAYTHTLFGSTGNIRNMLGWLDGASWTFTGESQRGGDARRLQVSITPTEKGFRFRQDVSTNGSPWQPAAEFDYVRVR